MKVLVFREAMGFSIKPIHIVLYTFDIVLFGDQLKDYKRIKTFSISQFAW